MLLVVHYSYILIRNLDHYPKNFHIIEVNLVYESVSLVYSKISFRQITLVFDTKIENEFLLFAFIFRKCPS